MADPINPTQLYDTKQTAVLTTLSPWTLLAHRKEGRGIPYIKLGPLVRYLGSDIQEFISENRVDPGAKKAKGRPAPNAVQTPVRQVAPHLRGLRGFSR